MKVITIANKKGGIGKTASTVALSALLGMYEQRVLVVDLNPGQANTSRYFNLQREVKTVVDVFKDGNISEIDLRRIIKPTEYVNIHLLPANETLCDDESSIILNREFILKDALKILIADYEEGNISEEDIRSIIEPGVITSLNREFILKDALKNLADNYEKGNVSEEEIRKIKESMFKYKIYRRLCKEFILGDALEYLIDDYDYVIIDCGPNMNSLVMNALCASDGVLIPVQAEGQCFDGFMNLLFVIKDIQDRLNPNINILGVYFTLTNPSTNTFKQYFSMYQREAGNKLLTTYIRRENVVNEAVSMKIPLPYYIKFSNAVLDYERLLRELDLINGAAAKKLHVKIRQGEAKELHRKKRDRRSRSKEEIIEE